MTNLRKYHIADISDVSYRLLRKWNSEERYKNQVRDHCKLFAKTLYGEIKKSLVLSLQKQYEKWLGISSLKDKYEDPLSDVRDVEVFSDQLKQIIMSVVGESIHGYKDLWIALQIEKFLGKQDISLLNTVLKGFQRMMSEDLKMLSSKNLLTEEDRQKLSEIGFYLFLFNNLDN